MLILTGWCAFGILGTGFTVWADVGVARGLLGILQWFNLSIFYDSEKINFGILEGLTLSSEWKSSKPPDRWLVEIDGWDSRCVWDSRNSSLGKRSLREHRSSMFLKSLASSTLTKDFPTPLKIYPHASNSHRTWVRDDGVMGSWKCVQ